jgi:hypothetical protein
MTPDNLKISQALARGRRLQEISIATVINVVQEGITQPRTQQEEEKEEKIP